MEHLPTDAIAFCPIATNNTQDICVLTPNAFTVVQKGKSKRYLLENIASMAIRNKKMLFPVVLGGIVGTFFFIAAFNFSFNIWASLALSCGGFMLLYYGWAGSPSVCIGTKLKEYDHFTKDPHKALPAFLDFITKDILPSGTKSICFYLPLSIEQWEIAQQRGHVVVEQKTYLYTYSQLHRLTSPQMAIIHLENLNCEVHIELSNNKFSPYVTSHISLDAIEVVNK